MPLGLFEADTQAEHKQVVALWYVIVIIDLFVTTNLILLSKHGKFKPYSTTNASTARNRLQWNYVQMFTSCLRMKYFLPFWHIACKNNHIYNYFSGTLWVLVISMLIMLNKHYTCQVKGADHAFLGGVEEGFLKHLTNTSYEAYWQLKNRFTHPQYFKWLIKCSHIREANESPTHTKPYRHTHITLKLWRHLTAWLSLMSVNVCVCVCGCRRVSLFAVNFLAYFFSPLFPLYWRLCWDK